MGELPFIPFTDSLKDVLRRNFIKSCSVWLLGKDESSLLAQAANSSWETALSISFLAEAREIFFENGEEKSLCDDIEFRSTNAIRWLLNKKIILGADHVSWDRGTWDTAVVIRALLTAIKIYSERFSVAEKRQINTAVFKGVRWSFGRFGGWEKEVKFPFGPCDVAQILITTIHIKERFPQLGKEIITPDDEDTILSMVEYLLHIRNESQINSEAVSYWIDFFNSAEVIESLAMFYNYSKKDSALSSRVAELLKDIELTYKQTYRYFENSQVDERWGTHAETCRVLYSYIKISTLIPIVPPEPHLVLKSLRWICDEKQFFSDGSFLHTMFITIFFYPALLQVYENWPLSKRKIQEIYDDIIWVSPMRTSPERSARLSAELRNRELGDLNAKYTSEKNKSERMISRRRRKLKKYLLTSFFLAGAVVVFLTLGNLLNILSFSFEPTLTVHERMDFLSYFTVYVAICVAILGLIWKYERIPK